MRIGELFCGYGGLGMAVKDVWPDAEVAWVSEFDKGPSKVLAHRFPDVPNLGDITKIDWTQVPPVDVITGGSPCQDLSHAGARRGMTDGTRSNLWVSMREAIATVRPRLVVWENVRGAYSAQADSAVEPCAGCVGDGSGNVLRALGRVLGDLSELGYDAAWCGLRAADVGAAHGRFRVFVLAWDAAADPGGIGGHKAVQHDGGSAPGSDGRGVPDERHRDALRAGPNGEVTLLPTPAVNDAQRRILDRVEVDRESGCWMWTGWTNQAATPYGRMDVDGQKVYAHRASYEAFVGPIPEGHEVDHLCQTSLCANPEHLEAVSPEENRDRVTQRRTHCKRGHEFTEENTYWVRPGARACRACRSWQDKVQKARRKGEVPPEPPLLPTPVTNDMGEGKTVEKWDAWTDTMKAKHGNGNGHGKSLSIEAQRLLPTPCASESGGQRDLENRRLKGSQMELSDVVREADRWGDYAAAIQRWEHVIGRPAPEPTQTSAKGNPQLSARFAEWLMGVPDGWITDVPGVTRNEALKMAGNGVVPQQGAAALRWLLGQIEAAA